MALFPDYNFSDPDLDYSEVLNTVSQMFVYLENSGCCAGDKCNKDLSEVDGLLTSIDEGIDQTDYEKSIEYSYKILKPLTE